MLNTEEFETNRDLWFTHSEEWPLLPCPVMRRKLVVLVPHPDDEIFGCAGLLQNWAPYATETVLIYVTAGEASHGYQSADDRAELARLRRIESQRALAALDLADSLSLRIRELFLPDAHVKSFRTELESKLREEIDSQCVVIAPYDQDGHTDHDEVGACARKLAAEVGCELYFFPVWMWFWRKPEESVRQEAFMKLFMSTDELSRKNMAMRCFESQILPTSEGVSVIPREFLDHYSTRPYEVLMVH